MSQPSSRPTLAERASDRPLARSVDAPRVLPMREPTTSNELLARVEDDFDKLDIDLRGRVPKALLPAALVHLEALRQAAESLKTVLDASETVR